MNVKKYLLLLVLLQTSFVLLMAQPNLNLWTNSTPHSPGPHTFHNSVDDENHIQITCGYSNYFYHSEGTQTTHYSICNDGDATLELQLPLGLSGTGEEQFSIIQPSQSSIAPNTCIDFSTVYNAPTIYTDAQVNLLIQSNAPTNSSCLFNYEVGAAPNTMCTIANPTCPGMQKTIYEEDFEQVDINDIPSGWTFERGLLELWTVDDDTETPNTGTDNEFCGKQMLVMETSPTRTRTNIISSSIQFPVDLTGEIAPIQLGFAHYMFGVDVGNLDVLVSMDGGTSFTSEYLQEGPDQASANGGPASWTQVSIDLSAYAGSSIIIKLAGTTSEIKFSGRGDILIDAIQIVGCQCPDLSALTEEDLQVAITESTCTEFGGTPDGGEITAIIATTCPAGSTLMYMLNDEAPTTDLPNYDQTTPQTIAAFCACNQEIAAIDDGGLSLRDVDFMASDMTMSVIGSVTTMPGTCPTVEKSVSVSDPCNCTDPANVTNADGSIIRFHDVLTLNGDPGDAVSCLTECGNYLDASGNILTISGRIPASGTLLINFYRSPGSYSASDFSIGGITTTLSAGSCVDNCPRVVPIPTLSQWGLSIFGLLILNMGLVFLRRKETMIA